MKTKFAIAAIALALSSSAAFATLNDLGNGKITINGLVKSSSCKVAAVNGDTDGVVQLANIDKSELVADTVLNAADFSIKVSNCDIEKEGGNLVVTLDATNMAVPGKGYLANIADDQSKAENVYIAVVDKNGASGNIVIPGKENYIAKKALVKDGEVVFDYAAGYVTENPAVATTGPVTGAITYVVSYN